MIRYESCDDCGARLLVGEPGSVATCPHGHAWHVESTERGYALVRVLSWSRPAA